MQTSPKSRVILHIGGAKCGSSAIQAYLAQNVASLAQRGVGVPGTALDFRSDVTGEQIWFFEDAASACDDDALVARLRARISDAFARDISTLIISAENICNHPRLAQFMAAALGEYDCTVMFYVRRQDDFLISSWQQWNLKRFASVEDFLKARAGKDARWLQMIKPWAEAFGDDRICVRPFVRSELVNGDVVDDFFAAIGVSQDGLDRLRRNANPSFDEALASLAHRARDVFDGPHDNRFYEAMVRLLGEAALKKGSASSLMSLETRREILELYNDENAALKARFMAGDPTIPLFSPPMPKDVLDRSELDRMSEDMAMLTRAVFALATRLEGGNA